MSCASSVMCCAPVSEKKGDEFDSIFKTKPITVGI